MAAPHAQYYPPPPQNPYYGHTAPQYVQPQPPMQYPAPRPMYMQPHSSNVTNNINVGGGNQNINSHNKSNNRSGCCCF